MKRSAYIEASLVQPGDVLLSTGRKWPISGAWHLWAVRLCTLSWFTHASVFMTQLSRLEANGPGLCAQLTVDPVVCDTGGRLLLATDCVRAVLLRPTEAALQNWTQHHGENATDFSKVICGAVLAYLGREYAAADLSGAALWPARLLAGAILQRFGHAGRNSSFVRRWFCSSLVAQAYEDAGLPLTRRAVTDVSPGTIRRSCVLQPVRGAVVRLQPMELGALAGSQPKHVISGALTVATMETLMLTAAKAMSRGSTVVLAELEAAIDALINDPTPALKMLLCRERELRRNGRL